MDVRLSPEQKALRDSVELVVGRLGPKVVADLDDDERSGKLDAAVGASGWRELRAAAVACAPAASAPVASAPVASAPVASAPAGSAPAGSAPAGSAQAGSASAASAAVASAPAASAPAASAPVASGPAGSAPACSAPLASAVEAALVAEELARGLADTPFLGPTLAAELRRRAGAAPATERETVLFRPDLSAPATVDAGLATIQAGSATVDAGSASSEARSGTPFAVAVDAGHASVALALQPGPDGALLVAVPIEAARTSVDLTRPSGVPATGTRPAAITDTRPLTEADLDAWTALGLALTCADLVGVMRGAVQLGCGYATIRRQYGSPIGSFQAVQHLLADAHVATEGSRSVALHAAWAVDALPPREAVAAGAVAKAYCARAALAVCETVIQVHGGIGNTWECLAHVFLRRALLSVDALGGVGPSLQRVLEHNGIGGDGRGLR
jgi:alkylation response protein AidB-like acyl-CoA dehydrogenase